MCHRQDGEGNNHRDVLSAWPRQRSQVQEDVGGFKGKSPQLQGGERPDARQQVGETNQEQGRGARKNNEEYRSIKWVNGLKKL